MSQLSETLDHAMASPNITPTEPAGLSFLATTRDQDDIERDIGRQADQLLTEQADARDQKRLDKTTKQKDLLEAQLAQVNRRLEGPHGATIKQNARKEKANLEAQIASLTVELDQINTRIEERHKEDGLDQVGENSSGCLPGETKREFLIRTGKITPFSKIAYAPRTSSNLADIMLDIEDEGDNTSENEETRTVEIGPKSHRNLLKPGFEEVDSSDSLATPSRRKLKRRRRRNAKALSHDSGVDEDDYVPSDAVSESDTYSHTSDQQSYRLSHRKNGKESDVTESMDGVDDGNERYYRNRVQKWQDKRAEARNKERDEIERINDEDGLPEWRLPHPTRPDAVIEGNFKVPGDIYPSLFDYQKTGVKWLWELYTQQVGGIIGDEMGLGKTIQIISFIAGLHYSNILTGPIIVVTPATVMRQWVNEFHRWWPPLRVSILHTSGSGMLNISREVELEDELEIQNYDDHDDDSKDQSAARRIVDRVIKHGHVLVTTYSGLQTYSDLLLQETWQYAVLDEGHKIRNPNTAITLHCKELRTPNRIILSGTPMQNNLSELWSLFDFVFPMRLGTLVTFRNQFEVPIKTGGYANASNLQVETAMRCAETLKEAISPYLLQRFKSDVASDLPKKSERVLFCRLTDYQRAQYKIFLNSEEMKSITAGKRQPLYGIDILRKICNHPDLVDHKTLPNKVGYEYGAPNKSGKMQVVQAVLDIWRKEGHKTLLFAQHRIMLDILEKFVRKMDDINYLRMDGNTSIKDRQTLVDRFNRNPNLHVFLLTTKVGGLGVNLTGANRVIIYDPDWNPSTDIQARERSWRLGQKKEVEIYRLMTAGTIEEKIYHRQIFKQFLTNKILRDPKQRQTFHLQDLHDLFTLADPSDKTETGALFGGTEIQVKKSSNNLSTQKKTSQATSFSRLDPVVRDEAYAPAALSTTTTNTTTTSSTSSTTTSPAPPTDRLLTTIFARQSLLSAHSHDAIIASNSTARSTTHIHDPDLISREARRVAARAASELARASEIARRLPAGVPTWTGTFGSAGFPDGGGNDDEAAGAGFGAAGQVVVRPGSLGRVQGKGMSGAALLEGLAARQGGAGAIANVGVGGGGARASPVALGRTGVPNAATNPRGKDFIVLIRDFLKAHGGSCFTQNLIDHFNRFCGTPQRTAEFREMLKRIAVLEKGGSRARGKWVLKEEFGGTS